MDERALKKDLQISFLRNMPSVEEMVKNTVCSLVLGNSPAFVKECSSVLTDKIQILARKEYFIAEQAGSSTAIVEAFSSFASSREETASTLLEKIARRTPVLLEFFQNSIIRRPSIGQFFETAVEQLFLSFDYPFDCADIFYNKPDFVLPSAAYYLNCPGDSIVFTVKHTIGKSWRYIMQQETLEGAIYIASADQNMTAEDLADMSSYNIKIVMIESFLRETTAYREAPNVITFEEFFRHHLDPAMERWRARHAF